MKNKASLVLMEQLVMILVFSLAAALCLRIFAWSDRTSREIRQQAEAVLLCQNAAEIIKASGSLEEAANALDALEQESDFPMEVRETESNVPGLGQAEIRILSPETGEGLYSLTVGWQEVLP